MMIIASLTKRDGVDDDDDDDSNIVVVGDD